MGFLNKASPSTAAQTQREAGSHASKIGMVSVHSQDRRLKRLQQSDRLPVDLAWHRRPPSAISSRRGVTSIIPFACKLCQYLFAFGI